MMESLELFLKCRSSCNRGNGRGALKNDPGRCSEEVIASAS